MDDFPNATPLAPEVYLHVNNGGITFKVLEDPEYGPIIELDQSQFGAVQNKLVVLTDPPSLRALVEMFQRAYEVISQREYVPDPTSNEDPPGTYAGIPKATKRAGFLSDANDPRRIWADLSGDLEASFDGARYVDIRSRFNPESRFFISRGALEAAVRLFTPEMAPRVATRWVIRHGGR